MLLSIIIPVYNEELTIGNIIDRVKAVVQQTGLKNEVIVVDDCSYDKSLEIAKKHSAKIYTLKKHLGKGYALRAGFAKAKGDIIVTIDSDGSHRPEELPRGTCANCARQSRPSYRLKIPKPKKRGCKETKRFWRSTLQLFHRTINWRSHN